MLSAPDVWYDKGMTSERHVICTSLFVSREKGTSRFLFRELDILSLKRYKFLSKTGCWKEISCFQIFAALGEVDCRQRLTAGRRSTDLEEMHCCQRLAARKRLIAIKARCLKEIYR